MRTRWLAPLLFLALGGCRGGEGRAEAKPAPGSSATPAPSASLAPAAPAAPVASAASVEKANRDGPRVYAKTRFVWIHPEPNGVGWIGYLWFGGSVKLRDHE